MYFELNSEYEMIRAPILRDLMLAWPLQGKWYIRAWIASPMTDPPYTRYHIVWYRRGAGSAGGKDDTADGA